MSLVTAKLTLHNQTIDNTMIHLQRCRDPRAQVALVLAQRWSIYPLNENELKSLRGKKNTKKPFSEDEWETPILYGPDESPFQKIPSISQIQQILITDISNNNNRFRSAPSRGSFELDVQAASNLLHNIQHPLYYERGAIYNLRSPTFDSLFTNKPKWEIDGIVGQSDMHMTVTPAHEVLDLAYHDYFHLSTLLFGSKTWIVYPPSTNNCALLKRAYQQLRGETHGSAFLVIKDHLEHGIIIVQQAGQTLMLPPFWPHIVFCPETTVSGGHLISTAIKFSERLTQMELYHTVLSIWPEPANQQRELLHYVETLAVHLRMIIGDELEYEDHVNVIKSVCAAWRQHHVQFARICRAIQNEQDRNRVARTAITAWADFLEDRRKKKPVCLLCNVRIENMPEVEGESIYRRLSRHFIANHFERAAVVEQEEQ